MDLLNRQKRKVRRREGENEEKKKGEKGTDTISILSSHLAS
jgi:hypothetical protein